MSEEDLPKGWESTRITEIADVNPRHAPELEDDLEVGFIPMSAVDEYLGAVTTFDVRQLGAVKKGYTPMQTGDVIFAKITPCMENGKAAIVCDLPSKTGFGSTEFFVIRPSSGIPPEWIHRFIRQVSYRRAAREHMAGAVGQARVPRSFLEETELPLAPLPEQRRIVAKLDALQSRTRIAREALDAVAPLLKSFRQSVLQAAVTGALTEEWRSKQAKAKPWTESKASEVCAKVQSGGTPKEGFISDPGIPFLKVYNIVNQRIQFEPRSQFVAESIHRGSMSKSIALPGDVLMNIVGPPLGKVAVVSDEYPEWNINQAITLFRPSERISTGWLYAVLCSGINIQEIVNETKGSAGQVNISLSQCRDFVFPLPPLTEQTEIVRRVHHLFAMADAMEAEFAAAQRSVDQLDQSLLATAFRGELVPQDPSDEPASVLLERIRAARAALPETKGKRGRKASSDFDASMLMAAEPAAPKKRGRPAKR